MLKKKNLWMVNNMVSSVRTYNYTGRKSIPQRKITIGTVKDQNDVIYNFSLQVDLNGLNLPGHAKIYVEPYFGYERKRFDFGTVDNFQVPKDTERIKEFGFTNQLRFAILIVDETDKYGRILAFGNKFKSVDDGKEVSLLPISFIKLDHLLWKLEYTDPDGPFLYVNEEIPRQMVKNTPSFFVSMMPMIFRDILTHMIFVDGIEDISAPEFWHKRWLNFIKGKFSNLDMPAKLNKPEGSDEEIAMKWINSIIKEYTTHFKKYWKDYIKDIEGSE